MRRVRSGAIFRDFPGASVKIPLDRKPVFVGQLLNENLLFESGGELTHRRSVFQEDQGHDWTYSRGRFLQIMKQKTQKGKLHAAKKVRRAIGYNHRIHSNAAKQ